MSVRIGLSSSEKVILSSGNTTGTSQLSDISLGYDAIFDEPYAGIISDLYAGTTPIPNTKLTSYPLPEIIYKKH